MHDPNEPYGVEEASKCLRFFRLLWKFFKCIFSHVALVSLVVAYCVLGAWAFVELEVKHEQEVRLTVILHFFIILLKFNAGINLRLWNFGLGRSREV